MKNQLTKQPSLWQGTRAIHPARIVAISIVTALLNGCATKPPTPAEYVAEWLSHAPRTLTVRVEPGLPAHIVRVRDHNAEDRIGGGIKGAAGGGLYTILLACSSGGPMGCAAGFYLAPVGMVVGAVGGVLSPKSVYVHHQLTDAKGAAELLQAAVKPAELTAQLAKAVVAEAAKDKRHVLALPDKEQPAQPAANGGLTLAVSALDLLGEVGEDPRVALTLTVRANLETPVALPQSWGDFTYTGAARRVSEWRASEELLFREEIAKGLEAIATKIVRRLHAKTPARPAQGARDREGTAIRTPFVKD